MVTGNVSNAINGLAIILTGIIMTIQFIQISATLI
jgi:hypothetical protein